MYSAVVLCFVSCRSPRQLRLAEEMAKAEAKVAHGGQMEALEDLCLSKSKMRRFEMWNAQLVWVLTVLSVGCYMVIGSNHVLSGRLSLGNFFGAIQNYVILGMIFEWIRTILCDRVAAVLPLIMLMHMPVMDS